MTNSFTSSYQLVSFYYHLHPEEYENESRNHTLGGFVISFKLTIMQTIIK